MEALHCAGHEIRLEITNYCCVTNVEIESIATYSLKARIVESQQLAVTKRPGNKRGMVFHAWSVQMVAHATMEYVMAPLSNNRTATERCFLRGPFRDVISRRVDELVSGVELIAE
jgi:hypothetical protein